MAKNTYRIVRPLNQNDSSTGVMLNIGHYIAIGEPFELDDTSHIYHNLCERFLVEKLSSKEQAYKKPIGMYEPDEESLSEEFDLIEEDEE
jgi:hypothetical protein